MNGDRLFLSDDCFCINAEIKGKQICCSQCGTQQRNESQSPLKCRVCDNLCARCFRNAVPYAAPEVEVDYVFETEKGSRYYVLKDGTSIRDKAMAPGLFMRERPTTVIVFVSRRYWELCTHRRASEVEKTHRVVPATRCPALGLIPYEFWGPLAEGVDSQCIDFSRMPYEGQLHFGHPITFLDQRAQRLAASPEELARLEWWPGDPEPEIVDWTLVTD